MGQTPTLARRKLMAIIDQSRFFFHIAPLLSVVAAFIAARNYDVAQIFLISLSSILILMFTSSVNNTYDTNTDQGSQLNSDWNPIVRGDLSLREAKLMNLVTPAASLLVGAFAGSDWIGLPLVAIPLVVLYDLEPFRLKDRPLGFLIVPLCQSLPFLFSYAAATSSFTLSPWVISVFAFLYFNTAAVTRHLPDLELDLKLGIQNFATVYGAEAAVRIDIIFLALATSALVMGVVLGGLSLAGMPILLISVTLQLRILAQGAGALANPSVYRRFSLGMIPNSVAMALSVIQFRL